MFGSLLKTGAAFALTLCPAALLAQVAQPAPQAAPAPLAAPAPVQPSIVANPALWVVKDEDTTIYLFGTIHVLKPGTSWFQGPVKKAFDDSEEVVLEMVMPDPQAMQALIQRLAINTGGPTLTDKLSGQKRAAYQKALGDLGLPLNTFDRTEPWFASVNLSLLPLIKLGYDPEQGVETRLTADAKAARKTITGLETAEQQLGFFKALPESAQIDMLNSTVEQLPKIQTMIETMIGSWSRAEPETLAKVMNEGLSDTPQVTKVLLTDRNARWAEWIDARLDRPGTVFVAVGAGHLAGRDSVIEALATHKLKATRLR